MGTKNNDTTTACIRNSGFSAKIKVNAFNKSFCQTESEVLLNPLLLIHAKRYQQGEENDSDTENYRENGLRMKNEMTMKEKRFSFFCRPTRKKSGKSTHIWHIDF